MNSEHLYKLLIEDYDKILNKKKAFTILRTLTYFKNWRRSKLKLGAVTFDFIDFTFDEFVIFTDVKMRYIRQDVSHEIESRPETILESYKWKWDLSNILAFIILLFIIYNVFYVYAYDWYLENLTAIAVREPKYIELVKFTVKTFFFTKIQFLNFLYSVNDFLIDAIIEYCLFFDILF